MTQGGIGIPTIKWCGSEGEFFVNLGWCDVAVYLYSFYIRVCAFYIRRL
jgi:hypothetical protein